jgi:hypothetical protein
LLAEQASKKELDQLFACQTLAFENQQTYRSDLHHSHLGGAALPVAWPSNTTNFFAIASASNTVAPFYTRHRASPRSLKLPQAKKHYGLDCQRIYIAFQKKKKN